MSASLLFCTLQLKSLASGKDTRVVKAHKNRGYAVQVTGNQNNIDKSVLGAPFHYFIRLSVYLINFMATLYSIPYLLNVATRLYPYIYSSIHTSPKWYAVTWAMLIMCTLLNGVIVVLNFWIVILPSCDYGFAANVAYFAGVFLVELVTVFWIPMKNYIKIPRFLQFCVCGCCCGNTGKLNLFIQRFAVWNALIFMQLLVEHTIFIIMAFIYHPFTTAGMFIVYSLCITCATLVIAIVMLLEELILCILKRSFYSTLSVLLCIADIAKIVYALMIILCVLVVMVGGAFMEGQRCYDIQSRLTSSSLNTSILIAVIGYVAAHYIKSVINTRVGS